MLSHIIAILQQYQRDIETVAAHLTMQTFGKPEDEDEEIQK